MNTCSDSIFDFDVALSFAAPEREIAREFARALRANDLRVFFDEDFAGELWGRNLVEALAEVYGLRARTCVPLISAAWCDRAWTVHERRIALDRALVEDGYLLPIVTDDAWPPSLPPSTAHLDLRKRSIPEIAAILVQKLRGPGEVRLPPPSPPKVEVATRVAEEVLPPKVEPSGLTFGLLRLDADDNQWQERTEWIPAGAPRGRDSAAFAGTAQSFYGPLDGDPVFDVTLVNRSAESLLLAEVGIEFLAVGALEIGLGGASAGREVLRSRVYCLDVPDLWVRLAEHVRTGGDAFGGTWVSDIGRCRLPDPILLEPGSAWRYGLHLLDYQALVPNRARVRFWIRTDRGEVRSPDVFVGYLIPGHYGGLVRLDSLVQGLEPEALALHDAQALAEWQGASLERRAEMLAMTRRWQGLPTRAHRPE